MTQREIRGLIGCLDNAAPASDLLRLAARAADVSEATVSAWLAGAGEPTEAQAQGLREAAAAAVQTRANRDFPEGRPRREDPFYAGPDRLRIPWWL